VYDDIDVVEHHPPALGRAGAAIALYPFLLELVLDITKQRLQMGCTHARSDHVVVRDRGILVYIKNQRILGLLVFQNLSDAFCQRQGFDSGPLQQLRF